MFKSNYCQVSFIISADSISNMLWLILYFQHFASSFYSDVPHYIVQMSGHVTLLHQLPPINIKWQIVLSDIILDCRIRIISLSQTLPTVSGFLGEYGDHHDNLVHRLPHLFHIGILSTN